MKENVNQRFLLFKFLQNNQRIQFINKEWLYTTFPLIQNKFNLRNRFLVLQESPLDNIPSIRRYGVNVKKNYAYSYDFCFFIFLVHYRQCLPT